MTDLITAADILSEFIYFAESNDLNQIALSTGVSPSLILYDNNIREDIKIGMPLIIKKRGSLVKLLPKAFEDKAFLKKIKDFNKCENLYPFMLVCLPLE